MNDALITLEMPIQLGRAVISSPVVQASLDRNPGTRVRSRSAGNDPDGASRNFGATALLILGTPSAAATVTGIFAVIRTAVKEAHKTRRELQQQDHEVQKLVLVLGGRRDEIDLASDLKEIETRIDELEQVATELAATGE